MKVVPIIKILASLWGLLVLAGPPAHAQSEIDPDHFELANEHAFEKAKKNASSEATEIRYDGKFSLPYTVQCNGRNLHPGEYSVSLRSDGKVGQATLNQEGRAIEIRGVIHKQPHKSVGEALVVALIGQTRNLSAIQVAEVELVFEPKPQREGSSDGKPRQFEKLPLTETVPKK